jgi:transposase
MFLRRIKRANGKVSIVAVEGYRMDGKAKQRVVKYYGTESQLLENDPEAIKKIEQEIKATPKIETEYQMVLRLSQKAPECNLIRNYGYFWLDRYYHKLGIDKTVQEFSKDKKIGYDLNLITRIMVFSRCLYPSSRRSIYLHQMDKFVEDFDVQLKSLYRALTNLSCLKNAIVNSCYLNLAKSYRTDASILYYDVTNYFFEIEKEDSLRKKGCSKEHRPLPIVQMGLFTDTRGLPVNFLLFPGNSPDCTTLKTALDSIKDQYSTSKVIITADKGLNSNANLGKILSDGNGYIFSQKIRGACAKLKKQVLSDDGWYQSKDFAYKSFIRQIDVTHPNGGTFSHPQRVICIWSYKYHQKEKTERAQLLEKVAVLADNPNKFRQSCHTGIRKYINETIIDKKTLVENKDVKIATSLNQKRLETDEELDGYYLLVTSELELPEKDVIKKYQGLWKIEQTFRITKSDINARPVYVRTQEHIEAHFLICFIALTILRMIELDLGGFSTSEITKGLEQAQLTNIGKEIYAINYRTEVIKALEERYDTILDKHYLKKEELKKFQLSVLSSVYTTA